MTWKWDVTETVTPRMDTNVATHSINLMCYLLHNITYNQLYEGDFMTVVERLSINVRLLPKSLDREAHTPKPIKQRLVNLMTRIDVIARGIAFPSDFRLGSFFSRPTPYDPADAPHEILTEIKALHQDASGNPITEMEHFCTPFVTAHDNGANVDTTDFLRDLGKYTLFDLYRLHDPGLVPAVRAAVRAGILQHTGPYVKKNTGLSPLVYPPQNYRRCDPLTLTCVYDPNATSWCNGDEEGRCTVVSG